MKKLLVIHGPNLNLLGKRNPEIYGKLSLKQINQKIENFARETGFGVDIVQSNSEAEIIESIHKASAYKGIVINAAAYSHTSVAIRDAIASMGIRTVEVHISNIYAREEFRKRTLVAPVCVGQISGLGWYGYILALDYLIRMTLEHE